MASCALRSFAALTIFMALVICCVEIVEVILFRTSFKLGINYIDFLRSEDKNNYRLQITDFRLKDDNL